MKLSIIIPVYNEEKTVQNVVNKVQKLKKDIVDFEIVLVNDASTDKTADKLEELKKEYPDLKIFTHTKNQGKGSALRTGFKKASGDYVVVQDADLEYDPVQLISLWCKINEDSAQVVYGTRLKRLPHLNNEEARPRFLLHYFGNRFLSLLTSILYGQWITDMETCYKMFPRSALNKIELKGDGFEFEPEITAKLIKFGYRITEIPITTTPRGYDEGKKLQTFPEGIKAVKTLIKYRFVN